MQASLETLGTLERRLKIAVPIDQINAEVANRLKRLQRTAKLHGFRPGKVPLKVVEQQYGPQVRQDVLGDTVERSFGDAVRENNLRVAGYPRIESEPAPAEASAFEYTATFEVFPEIAIGDLSAVAIERPVVTIGDADIDRTVDILRKQRHQYEPVERAAAAFDRWRDLIAHRLIADGVPRKQSDELAALVIAALEGALVLCRAGRDVAPLDAVHRQLRVLLKTATERKP